MAGRISDGLRPLLRSFDDVGHSFDGFGGVSRNVGGQQRRNIDGTHDVDRYSDSPDAVDAPSTHRPGDGSGSSDSDPAVPEKRRGVDRGDGRDDYGHFVGSDNTPWVDKEKIGLDEVADDLGVDVIRDKVRATIPGYRKEGATTDQSRYFDGLYRNADGAYTGIEVKSGNAGRDAAQRGFDETVSRDRPATAILDGNPIDIVRVILKEVP